MPEADGGDIPLGLLLKQAQHTLRVALDHALQAVAMTMPQWGVLRAIHRNPGISGAEIARAAFLSPQGVNRVLTHLDHIGCITRQPSGVHGRVLAIHLTAQGSTVLAQCEAVYAHLEQQMVGALSPAERTQLRTMLERCMQDLQHAP